MTPLTSDLGRTADGYLARSLSSERRRTTWADDRVDDALWKDLAQHGWFAALLPEEHLGLGLGLADVLEVFTALGHHLLPGPFLEHMLLLPELAGRCPELGSLSELINGDRRMSWWDPTACAPTRPVPRLTDDNRLVGRLEGLRFAQDCDDVLVVGALTGGEPAVVLVSPPATRPDSMTGPRDGVSKMGSLDIDAPALTLLTGTAASTFAEDALALARVSATFELSGIVNWMVDSSVGYAKVREQFGAPIGTFQVVSHMLADCAVRDIALRNTCLALSEDARHSDISRERAMAAKAYAASTARLVAETTLQVHGGVGFTQEHPLHMYFKRALALYAWCGDPDRLAIAVGRHRFTTTAPGNPKD